MPEWVRDRDEYAKRYASCGGSIREMERQTGLGRRLLGKWSKIHGVASVNEGAKSSIKIDGDQAEIVEDRQKTNLEADKLIRSKGLDPADWIQKSVSFTDWESNSGDGEKIMLHRMKVNLVRKKIVDVVVPARITGNYIAPRIRRPIAKSKLPQLWVVAGDEQAKFHQTKLHSAVCGFLAAEKPYGMVGTGDLTDQNSVSKHKPSAHRKNNSELQEDVNAGGTILRNYRRANEDMEMHWMPGNHDIRLGVAVQLNVTDAYGLTAAQWEDEEEEQKELLSLPTLLRLDELDINYVDPEGEYHQGQFNIGPHVAVRHGSKTGKNAALQTIDRLTHSIIMGHTHSQSIQNRTIYDIDRRSRVVTCAETGALCLPLDYVVDANWQYGFVTVMLWPDGSHHIETAVWDGEKILWRDKRY